MKYPRCPVIQRVFSLVFVGLILSAGLAHADSINALELSLSSLSVVLSQVVRSGTRGHLPSASPFHPAAEHFSPHLLTRLFAIWR